MDPWRGASSRRSGRTRRRPNPVVTRSSNSRPARPLSLIRISPGRSAAARAASASSAAATSRSPSRRAGQAPRHRHPVGGGEQVELQAPVVAGVGSAVAVAGPPGQLGAFDRFPGRAAGHRRGIDQPHLVAPRGRLAGQVIDRRGQQRRGGFQPLVVPRLMGQVGEQVPQPGVAHPQPVMLRPGAQQHLRHRQAHQLGVGQLLRLAGPAPARWDHMIVDLHIQCGQEGVQVCCHERSWMPSSHVVINPTRRAGLNQESLI